VVDEYATEFLLPQQTSRRPFSLGQLIRFLDSVEQEDADPSWNRFGFVLSPNQCNLECGTDLETLRDFTSVSSDFYPDLASHYREAIEEVVFGPRMRESPAQRGSVSIFARGFEGYREECGRAATKKGVPAATTRGGIVLKVYRVVIR
jgi:hypothetical protein